MSNKFYACSDLYGNWNLYEKILQYLDDTDKLIYLGDACDRGPAGIKIMQSLLSNDNIVYLLGNHERMFLNALKMNAMDYYDRWGFNYYNDMELWAHNGGKSTYNRYLELNIEQQEQLRKSIAALPIYAEYINKNNQHIFLCHSGIDIDKIDSTIKNEKHITYNEGYTSTKIYVTDENPFIWNRDHLYTEEWNKNKKYENTYIVHGHTPTMVLHMLNPKFEDTKEKVKIIKYCEGHKIDIDIGTYTTNVAALLDLDTLEPIYIQ